MISFAIKHPRMFALLSRVIFDVNTDEELAELRCFLKAEGEKAGLIRHGDGGRDAQR